MAILNNVEIWWVKLDPKRPSKSATAEKPSWEIQIRTADKVQRAEWTKVGVKTKAVRQDKDDEESPVLYYVGNLRKKSVKADGTPAVPVNVWDGKHKEVDPNTIGNGSIANLRIFQRDYSFKDDQGVLREGISNDLMAVQLVKHIIYTAAPMEDFGEIETETVTPAAKQEAMDEKDVY